MSDFIVPDRRGLVAEYLLNGDTRDSSGNGYNGTASNVTYSKTDRGYQRFAGNFNGSNSYVSVGNQSSLQFGTGDFSVSFVVTNSADTIWISNMSSSTLDGVAKGYNINRVGNRINFITWEGNANTEVYPSTTFGNLVGAHLTCVRQSGTLSVYVNGSLIGSASGTIRNVSTSRGFDIGRYNWNNSQYANGSIQSVRIFNRALSETEIRNWYLESMRALGGSSLAGLTDGLVAQINTTDGNELSDIVGGVAVTKTSGTAATDNLGYTRAVTNPNYTWPSITYTTGYAFENAGSGWVLTQTPSGLSATGINRTTTLREVFLFNRTLSAVEKNALETLCKLDYVLPFDGPIRYSLPTQLKEGCVLFIPGEVNGTTVYDASGNSNHGTLVNSPTPTRGGLCGYEGLKFNGTSQYAEIASSVLNAELNDGGAFAVSFVFLTSSSALMGLLDTRVTDQNGFFIQMNSGQLQAVRSDGSVADICTAVGTWNDGRAHSATVRYDSSNIRVSIDGGPEVTTASTRSLNSSTVVNIGSVYNSNVRQYYYSGCLGNVTINNAALTKEKAELYAKAFFIP